MAATGAAFGTGTTAGFIAGLTTAIPLFVSAATGIHAARPRDWSMVGYDPPIITSDPLGSELEIVESLALALVRAFRPTIFAWKE